MSCLTDDTVLAFVQGRLVGAALEEAERHAASCARCRSVVAAAARLLPVAAAPAGPHGDEPSEARDEPAGAQAAGAWSKPRAAPGRTISKYTLLEPIGMGAAGTVFLAYDTQLRRRIALKVLPLGAARDDAQARWLREAQAMAQLSHPNVVTVYDAGVQEGEVFIAMELVGGKTLAQFLAAESRGWREVLKVFIEAARGLAAAHAAGLVHRDFKPENVLIAEDGRVRVTDFGLARPTGSGGGEGEGGLATLGPLPIELTTAGALVGTPAYMAPEQFLRRPVDARTDQFGFCVALYAALYGQRPFGPSAAAGADPLQTLAHEVTAGHVRAPPAGSEVPAAIFKVLNRGLSVEPNARFASMDALIDALETAAGRPARPRRWRHAAMGVLIAGLGGAVAVGLWRVRARAPGVCGDGVLRPFVEECDDGNRRDGDGCSAACLVCGRDGASTAAEGGHCYVRHDGPLPWAEARAACWAASGHLVTYTSGYDVEVTVRSLLAGSPQPHWTGLVRRAGKLSWENEEPQPENMLGIDWRAGPGGEGTGDESCAAQLPELVPAPNAPHGMWTSRPCVEPLPFICERTPYKVRPLDGHAYVVSWRPVAWKAARDACRARGAHLVTLADAEEEAFVRAFHPGKAWLGATDTVQQGRFAWITGEPFTYQNFAPNEPDASTIESDCLAVDVDARWHDRSCGNESRFVCEVD